MISAPKASKRKLVTGSDQMEVTDHCSPGDPTRTGRVAHERPIKRFVNHVIARGGIHTFLRGRPVQVIPKGRNPETLTLEFEYR